MITNHSISFWTIILLGGLCLAATGCIHESPIDFKIAQQVEWSQHKRAREAIKHVDLNYRINVVSSQVDQKFRAEGTVKNNGNETLSDVNVVFTMLHGHDRTKMLINVANTSPLTPGESRTFQVEEIPTNLVTTNGSTLAAADFLHAGQIASVSVQP